MQLYNFRDGWSEARLSADPFLAMSRILFRLPDGKQFPPKHKLVVIGDGENNLTVVSRCNPGSEMPRCLHQSGKQLVDKSWPHIEEDCFTTETSPFFVSRREDPDAHFREIVRVYTIPGSPNGEAIKVIAYCSDRWKQQVVRVKHETPSREAQLVSTLTWDVGDSTWNVYNSNDRVRIVNPLVAQIPD